MNIIETKPITQYIIDLLSSVPSYVQIVLLIVLLPLSYLLYKVSTDKVFRTDLRMFIKSYRRSNILLYKHDIFINTKILTGYIDNIKYDSSIKDDIFRMILKTKIDIVMKKMRSFISDFNNKYKDSNNLEEVLFNIIDAISKEFHQAVKDNLITRYKGDGDFLFDYVFLEHYVPYNSHNISYLMKVLQAFSKSRINNTQKAQMFLSLVNIYIETSILDCEKAFDILNGTLVTLNAKHYGICSTMQTKK